jgi:hypothetical protein
VPVGALDHSAQRFGQRADVGDAVPAAGGARDAQVGQPVCGVVGDPVAEHRAERGDAERAAERAEEGDQRAGRAEIGCRHLV